MNNDNDLNLHSMTILSGWLRHCLNALLKNSIKLHTYLQQAFSASSGGIE